jgi:hypothetical protein
MSGSNPSHLFTGSRALAAGVLVFCSGCGHDSASAQPQQRASLLRAMSSNSPAATPMSTFEDSGYKLSGAEYWPYVGALEPRYPEDVMWGFYPKKGVTSPGETDPNPDTASRAGVACAERAYAELKAFIANRPKDFDLVVDAGKDQGISRLFYLWTNDYTRATDPYPPGVRPARLWYWKRKTPDPQRPPGYWKWESVLTQKGECKTPNVEEAKTYLREKREELAKASTATPATSAAPASR